MNFVEYWLLKSPFTKEILQILSYSYITDYPSCCRPPFQSFLYTSAEDFLWNSFQIYDR